MNKASFTIEAALLMPCILLVLFGLFYLNFHVRNRAALTAASCEQAITGHDPENPDLFGAMNLSRSKSENESSRTVSFSADTIALYGNWKWSISEKAEYLIADPVKLIRQIRAAKKITEGQDGN